MPLDKEVPWCTVFLCGTALLCHTMVLNGNMMTSAAIGDMGKSVKGWSDIGMSVSTALHVELDALLGNVTDQMTEAIQTTIDTQEMVDSMLSQMGESTEAAALIEVKKLSLIQGQVIHKETGEVVQDPMDAVMKTIMKMLGSLPAFQGGLANLQDMMQNIKPALLQVGVWVETFADKVQTTVEAFGTTLDRVQKIFDHVMSQISPNAGLNTLEMQHETFNLFDVDGSGAIDVEDLGNLADIYAVDAVAGAKGEELIQTYDIDQDGVIDTAEFAGLVEDPSIVGIMATVLRAYAKRLSMVAGKVGGSRMRDDVATNVVGYFQLVCSKNITKVGWIADMLTNATLPLPFSADVMIEMALAKDDPNTLTTADVGEIVVGMMMQMNSDYTGQAVDLLSTSEHWESEGLNMDDMAGAVKQINSWVKTGPDAVTELESHMITLEKRDPAAMTKAHHRFKKKREESLRSPHCPFGFSCESEAMDTNVSLLLKVLNAMDDAAVEIARERKGLHLRKRHQRRAAKRRQLFGTPAQQTFLIELLHGQAAQDGGPLDMAEAALASGVAAKPETLLFAQWLMANASTTANGFQAMCFDYTGESSSALDAFNTQIQGMVKKISGFIDIMKPMATPAGIEKMEQMVLDFASNAMKDVFGVVVDQVIGALEGSADLHELKHLKHHILDPAAKQAANHTATEIVGGVVTAVESLGKLQPLVSRPHLSPDVTERYKEMQAKYASHKSMDARESQQSLLQVKQQHRHMRMERLSELGWVKKQAPEVPAGAAGAVPAGAMDQMSGIWMQVSDLLRTLEKVLPQAIDLLKFSRKEVSAVSETLDSIFSTLEEKGVPIFALIAAAWSYLWIFYYVLVMPLTAGILFYGFWAGGFFGGPKPTNEEYVPPTTCWERCCCVCNCCCNCCRRCHDRALCFWSFIIIFQVIVLLLFIVAILFVIIGAVQIFMGTACSAIVILGDTAVCTETLNMLSTFLSTFQVGAGEVPLSMSCEHYNLKTCDLIQNKMLTSTILTIVGAFLAAILSFQMIFATALLHERARWRRIIAEMEEDQKPKDENKEEGKKEEA